MKTFLILLFLLFGVANQAYSQSKSKIWQVIKLDELKDFTLNGKINLYEILNLEEDWDQLRAKLGTPIETVVRDRPEDLGLRPTHIFFYPGLKIRYSDSYADGSKRIEFASAKFTNSEPFLEYKGENIRVNQHVKILEELFPEAFKKRRDIPLDDTGAFSIKLNVEKLNVGISFRYHPDKNIIEEISFYQIYT